MICTIGLRASNTRSAQFSFCFPRDEHGFLGHIITLAVSERSVRRGLKNRPRFRDRLFAFRHSRFRRADGQISTALNGVNGILNLFSFFSPHCAVRRKTWLFWSHWRNFPIRRGSFSRVPFFVLHAKRFLPAQDALRTMLFDELPHTPSHQIHNRDGTQNLRQRTTQICLPQATAHEGERDVQRKITQQCAK